MSNRRYMVFLKSGRKFMVEEIGDPHTSWGDIDPATKKLNNVYSKVDDVITEQNSQITQANGFKNIVTLNKGTSPIGYIEAIDKSGVERFESLDCGEYEEKKTTTVDKIVEIFMPQILQIVNNDVNR